jgi:hypothetical protein
MRPYSDVLAGISAPWSRYSNKDAASAGVQRFHNDLMGSGKAGTFKLRIVATVDLLIHEEGFGSLEKLPVYHCYNHNKANTFYQYMRETVYCTHSTPVVRPHGGLQRTLLRPARLL